MIKTATRSCLMALILVVGCSSAEMPSRSEPSAKARKYLGDEALWVLAGGTRVETFRIDGESRRAGKSQGPGERIGSYLLLSRGKDQGPDFAADLAAVLFKDETYFDGGSACFSPGVVFRVWNGEASADILVCFKCNNFEVNVKDAEGQVTATKYGCFINSPARAELIHLSMRAFPDDPVIQGLKG
jgi:hypothetical protein